MAIDLDLLISYSVISIDVFNTILLRKTLDAQDVFVLVGDVLKKKEYLMDDISSEAFRKLRVEAEKKCLEKKIRKGETEYKLLDIYSELEKCLGLDARVAAQTEIEVESKITYLNPFIHQILLKLHDIGKRICLTSDMYLSSEEILFLLQNVGFDLNMVEAVFVSSDYGVSKEKGLFEIVKKQMGVSSSEIVHIGDNTSADIIGAKKSQIQGILYPIFKDIPLELFIEKSLNCCVNSLFNLRLLFFAENKKKCENFWYREGALVWGPIISLYAEWVVKLSLKYGIKHIYPLMREGVLIGKVIRMVLENRNVDIECKEMYVSRNTTYLASNESFSIEMFDFCFRQPYISIGAVLDFLGIEDRSLFEDDSISCLQLLKEGREKEVFHRLNDDESILDAIETKCAKKREELTKYLREFDIEEPFVTCDIGFAGSISSSIDKVLEVNNLNGRHLHLLLSTSKDAIKNVLNGSEIIGFLQQFEEYDNSFSRYCAYTESLFMGDEGCTIGYKEEFGKIVPITEVSPISQKEAGLRRDFQKGVLDFEKLYLDLRKRNMFLYTCKEAENQLMRLFTCPTKEEADNYLELMYEQNLGFGTTNEKFKGDRWKEALDAQVDMTINYLRSYEKNKRIDEKLSAMIEICDKLQEKGVSDVIVYGAGEVGRAFSDISRVYGIKIHYFVDRDSSLWGVELQNNVRVYPVSKLKENNNTPIVIASLSYQKEIKDTVYGYNSDFKVF